MLATPIQIMAIFNIDFIYPIGSIYMSTKSINPSTLFGGTWTQTSQGRVLLGAGTPVQNNNTSHGSLSSAELTWGFGAGQTLGEYNHLLSILEIPSHTHSIDGRNGGGSGAPFPVEISGGEVNWNSWVSTGATGGGSTHNNIQPSLVVYIWERTA